MKIHSTNYYNAFIAVADDFPSLKEEVPAEKRGQKTATSQQLEMIGENHYQYTSDEVLFTLFAQRNDLTGDELEEARKKFFSKGQACLRASALGKIMAGAYIIMQKVKLRCMAATLPNTATI